VANEIVPVIRVAPKARRTSRRPPPFYLPTPPGSPVAAALIAGFAIYVPIPIVRGAIFGLMPGIAWRSWRPAALGALCGAFAEFVYLFFLQWMLVGWNTRADYCELLLTHLPPGTLQAAFPCVHPLPNSVHFVIIIVSWSALLFPMWYVAWPYQKGEREFCIFVAVVVTAVTATAIWLWTTAPPGPYMRSGISKANEAEIMRFLATNFIFAFSPACALAGWTLAKLTLPSSTVPPDRP
jgi:hypothetical protein